jgi:hypothetical protein
LYSFAVFETTKTDCLTTVSPHSTKKAKNERGKRESWPQRSCFCGHPLMAPHSPGCSKIENPLHFFRRIYISLLLSDFRLLSLTLPLMRPRANETLPMLFYARCASFSAKFRLPAVSLLLIASSAYCSTIIWQVA